MLELLDVTRRETRLAFSGVDPERIVHHDQPAWRVRDVLGHVGVWNGEAGRSLEAHAKGDEYQCIPSAQYDEYNEAAAEERGAWAIERVWAEYEASANQLKTVVEAMPAQNWNAEILYPWNERGTVRRLIEIVIRYEVEHRDVIAEAPN
jgi:hypothetical protein